MKLSIAILLITVELTITLARDIANTTEIDSSTITTAAPTENTLNLPCKTGKGVSGTCAKRDGCDYGTPAVDFTLYEPKGFKRICSSGEVCCPQDSLVQQDSKIWAPEKDKFDFDDDD